jgi:isopentenyl-diphosphate Delta-isomerase
MIKLLYLMNYINLVNKKGERIGKIEKLEAHKDGKLHEAFSIFIFNKNGELLIQKRASSKYHSGGLWSNTCCSHPKVSEKLEQAVHRRLKQEMGFDCNLKKIYSFIYKTKYLSKELIEHELDHVFFGYIDSVKIKINRKEVVDYKWIKLKDLKKYAKINPKKYSEWLKIILRSKKFNQAIRK